MSQPLSSTKVVSILREQSTAKECGDDNKTSPDQPQSPTVDSMRRRRFTHEDGGGNVWDNGSGSSILRKHAKSGDLLHAFVPKRQRNSGQNE